MNKIKLSIQLIIFFSLSLVLYFLFLSIGSFNQVDHVFPFAFGSLDQNKTNGFLNIIFASTFIIAFLGSILIAWIPRLNPGIASNLLAMTFFYLWLLGTLSAKNHNHFSIYYLSIILGLIFLYLFFYIIDACLPEETNRNSTPEWIHKIVIGWLWCWMGFYFILSAILALESFGYSHDRLYYSFGSLALCFSYFLVYLHLKNTKQKSFTIFSFAGRMVFIFWLFLLFVLWVAQKILI